MLNKLKKVVGATMLTGMMVYLMGTIVTYANNKLSPLSRTF